YKNPKLEEGLDERNFDLQLLNKRQLLFSERHSTFQKAGYLLGVFYEEYYYNKRAELFGNRFPMAPYEMKAFVRLRESELNLVKYDYSITGVVEKRTYFDEETGEGEYKITTKDANHVYFFTTNDDTVYKDPSNYYYSNHVYFGGIPDPTGKTVLIRYDEFRNVDEFNEIIIKALLIEQQSE
ncbi:MAG: hypothetical protein JXR56_06530, partial [Candidatus Cloacimonetes bacterium]|nr:hypothetical protein [Candidatus Cloacimonadota bacterium]